MRDTKPHGTLAAARRHYRHGEKPLKNYCMKCYFAAYDAQRDRNENDPRTASELPAVKSPLAGEIILLHKLFPHYSRRQLAEQLKVSHQHVSRVLRRQGQESGKERAEGTTAG